MRRVRDHGREFVDEVGEYAGVTVRYDPTDILISSAQKAGWTLWRVVK
jgi:hypothetical protein